MAVLLHVALHVRLECLHIWSGLSVLCLWIREIALLVRLEADVAQSRRVMVLSPLTVAIGKVLLGRNRRTPEGQRPWGLGCRRLGR